MALRESVRTSHGPDTSTAADLDIATGRGREAGHVPHGAFLATLAEAVANWRWDEAASLRRQGIAELGAAQTRDAILVASGFNGITRVADAIGIRPDPWTAAASVELRARHGIDSFAPAAKWS